MPHTQKSSTVYLEHDKNMAGSHVMFSFMTGSDVNTSEVKPTNAHSWGLAVATAIPTCFLHVQRLPVGVPQNHTGNSLRFHRPLR